MANLEITIKLNICVDTEASDFGGEEEFLNFIEKAVKKNLQHSIFDEETIHSADVKVRYR